MITLNGKSVSGVDGITIASLIAREQYSASYIAVACNGEVVPRGEYSNTQLNDGDVIDIVRMVAGG